MLPLITDTLAELLSKIIEFTKNRRRVLTSNINNMHNPAFVPKDLAVREFSMLLNEAVDEYNRNQRLLLCDTENIKFGRFGSFAVSPVTDANAKKLLRENPDEYLQLQINKLLENSLNQRVAAELLMQKHGMASILE